MSTTSSLSEQRRAAVAATLADVRQLVAAGAPDRAALAAITARLEALAAQRELFTRADFPPPESGQGVGASIAFLPDDVHSIHVVGDSPTLHFHLYGKPLERLTGRIGINAETGAITNYNATQFQPSKVAA